MMQRRETCPACGSNGQKIVREWSYSDPSVFGFLCAYYHNALPDSIRQFVDAGSFVAVECPNCTLLYQRDVPDAGFLTEIYEHWVIEDDWLAPAAKPVPPDYSNYMATEIMHLLAEQRRVVGTERRISVLDFGMGWSNWLQLARGFGATVFGSELSQPKIEHAKSIGIPVLTMGEILQRKFDVIAAEQVLEHVTDPASILDALVAALADTGFIKISVPDGRHVKSVLKSWRWEDTPARREALMPILPLEHINCFTRPALDAFAARYSLKPAPVSVMRAIGNSAGWCSAKAIAKNLLRPAWRFTLGRGCYAVYAHR
jgi:hypothetical protein